MKINRIFFIILLLAGVNLTSNRCLIAEVTESRILDRAAVERVYHNHRTGTKQSFEEAMPESMIRQLVQKELKKERVLKSIYGISINDQQIQAEVNRINSSTRAPEMLEEIKTALGNDPGRFANTVVKPILVEKVLRSRYNNDARLHANDRGKADSVRGLLLEMKNNGLSKQIQALKESDHQSNEMKWQMGPRPEQDEPTSLPMQSPQATKGTAKSGAYTIESTTQIAQVLSSPTNSTDEMEHIFYFEDLHPELQKVLLIQLQNPGDVSAVIERPTGFQLFLLKERTYSEMLVVSLVIQKPSYDEWLAKQAD